MKKVSKELIIFSLKRSYRILTTLYYLTSFIAILFVITHWYQWNLSNILINVVIIVTITFIYKKQLVFMNGIYKFINSNQLNEKELDQYGVATIYSLVFVSTYFIPLLIIVVLNTLSVLYS
jgi:hypothetical protein